MIVYAESNFVLELALLQEQHASCEEVLRLAEAERLRLVLPAYSLVEPYETLGRHHRQRKRLKGELDQALEQLRRTLPNTQRVEEFRSLSPLILIDSAEEEVRRLEDVRARILAVAEAIPLDADVLRAGRRYQRQHDLSAQDAVVYASVLKHQDESGRSASCFLNRNAKDFDDPDVVDELSARNCKMLPMFTSGLGYVRSRLA